MKQTMTGKESLRHQVKQYVKGEVYEMEESLADVFLKPMIKGNDKEKKTLPAPAELYKEKKAASGPSQNKAK